MYTNPNPPDKAKLLKVLHYYNDNPNYAISPELMLGINEFELMHIDEYLSMEGYIEFVNNRYVVTNPKGKNYLENI